MTVNTFYKTDLYLKIHCRKEEIRVTSKTRTTEDLEYQRLVSRRDIRRYVLHSSKESDDNSKRGNSDQKLLYNDS